MVVVVGDNTELYNALLLFKLGKVSIAEAASMAALGLYEFMAECKKHQISVMDEKIDLASELVGLQNNT
jgi:predicted HTH domain antitoxin